MADRPVVAVVGASVRAAAFSLLRGGLQPLAADCFRDADLARQCRATQISGYPGNLESWLKEQVRSRPSLVWCYTGALENHSQLVDRMAHVARLAGNRGEQLRRVRSPGKLAEVLAAAGLRFPETRVTAEGLPCDGSWLAKTCRGASGNGVSELRSLQLQRGVVYQRRVCGTPCAAVFVGDGQAAVCLGVTRQLIGEAWSGGDRFQYSGSVGPISIGKAAGAEIDRLGNALVDAFQLKGLFGVDFVLHNDEVWTVEVNPRYTASVEVLEAACGLSAMERHFDACAGRITAAADHTVESDRIAGKAIVFARQSCEISERLSARMLSTSAIQDGHGWGDVPHGGTTIPKGHPIATAFATAESCEAVVARLMQQVAELRRHINSPESLPCE